MPEELARQFDGQVQSQSPQRVHLQVLETESEDDGRAHRHHDGACPVGSSLQDDLVEEHLHQDREQDSRQNHQKTDEDAEGDGKGGASQPFRDCSDQTRSLSAFLELIAGLHRQRNSSEASLEVLEGNDPVSHRWIIDVNPILLESFQDNEMIELPEEDAGHLQVSQGIDTGLDSIGFKSITASGSQYIGCLAAVSGNTAVLAQLGERFDPAVIAEDHRQRGGTTLHRLQLEYSRCLHSFSGNACHDL